MQRRKKMTYVQKLSYTFFFLVSGKKYSIICLLLLIAVLPFTMFLVNKQTQFRQHAATNSIFITRSGTTLLVNGNAFRLTGYNWHWSGYNCTPPSTSDIDAVFNQIKTASKGNAVRTAFY